LQPTERTKTSMRDKFSHILDLQMLVLNWIFSRDITEQGPQRVQQLVVDLVGQMEEVDQVLEEAEL